MTRTVYFPLSTALLSTFILSLILTQFLFRLKLLKTLFIVSLGLPRSRFYIKFIYLLVVHFIFLTFLIDFAENFQRYLVDLD